MRKLLFLLPLLLGIGVAEAAVTPNSVVTPQTPNRGVVQFTSSSSAGTYATLYTGGTNGSKCEGLWATNSDTVSHLVTVQIINSTVKYGGVAVTVPAGAGFVAGVPPVALLTSGPSGVWPGPAVDSDTNSYINLVSGDTLQATFATSITSGDVVNVVASNCADY
jgi:hypothetical protein